MFKDDDEEEENTFGVTRYPCMPSLVALQQMRNRLHLAFLGRKLMKWTALATGRELRRLAQELYEVYDGFGEDLRNAFILLARSRYFCPGLNGVVTEDIGKKAGVLVQQCGKTVSGVKIIQFEIYETEYPPYPHLGLEKGGQTILETKKAWLDLLKRLIMMMQLRAGFLMVELANRNANKKMNVLKRIVIPRTNMSVGYILTELEEMAREEFHRLKKVKEKKKRDYELRHKKDEPKKISSSCKICETEQVKPEIETTKQLGESIEPITIVAITPESAPKPDIIPSKTKFKKEIPLEVLKPPEPEPFVELYTTPSAKSSATEATRDEKLGEDRLEYLKLQLNELIVLGKEFLQAGVDSIDIDEFLKMCEEAKMKLEQFFAVDEYPKVVDTKLERKLEHLKCHLREVIDITKEYKPEATLTSSIENFIKMCDVVDEKLEICKKGLATTSLTIDNDKVCLEEFKDIITDVENITKEYNKKGLLSSSAEAFLKSCCEMKSKVNKCIGCKKNKITISDQPSIEKQRSEVKPVEEPKPVIHSEIQHLIKHIDETIDLGMEAREEGLISNSVADFIKSFDEIKSRITLRDEKPEVLQILQLNIQEIMNLIERLKKDGIVTASIEDVLKLCEETKNKLSDSHEKSLSTTENYSKANSFTCLDSCLNNTEKNADPNRYYEERPLLIDIAPCDSCSAVVRIKEVSNESLCVTCSQREENLSSQTQTILNSSDQSQETVCESSKKDSQETNVIEDKQTQLEDKTESSPSVVDSKLGYFEKKLQKKVKVTRTQHTDGTIWEQKETITIRKEKHDPTETSLAEDDDISDESSDENINEQVNVCLVSNLMQRGFIRNFRQTRSDIGCKNIPYPCLRYSLSADNCCLAMREQMSFCDSINVTEIELLDTDLNYLSCLSDRATINQ